MLFGSTGFIYKTDVHKCTLFSLGMPKSLQWKFLVLQTSVFAPLYILTCDSSRYFRNSSIFMTFLFLVTVISEYSFIGRPTVLRGTRDSLHVLMDTPRDAGAFGDPAVMHHPPMGRAMDGGRLPLCPSAMPPAPPPSPSPPVP